MEEIKNNLAKQAKKLKLLKNSQAESLTKKIQKIYLSFFCRQSFIAALIASSARTEQ